MHWIRVTNPKYDQSQPYRGKTGEVVGKWGPENSADAREGFLVDFGDGQIVGIADDEAEIVETPRTA